MPKKRTEARRRRTLSARRKRVRTVLVALVILGYIGLAVGAVIGLRDPRVNLSEVEVLGTVYAREDLVRALIEEKLSGAYAFLIPRANAFLFPRRDIANSLKKTFTPIRDVRIRRDGFMRLSVSVEERRPHSLWCVSFSDDAPCYFMDEEGVVFFKTEEPFLNALVFSGLLMGDPLGQRYFADRYRNLYDFIAKLEGASDRIPERVFIDEHGDVYVSFIEGGEVRFTSKTINEPLLVTIASVFASRRFATDEALEYADFRFGNKIYVKFEGE